MLFVKLELMPEQIEEEKALLAWDAPERIYTKRGKTYFRKLFTLLAIIAAVAIFFKEFILAGALAALGFFQWVMGTNPPKVSRITITSRGIKAHEYEYEWSQLKEFWFAEHGGQMVLHLDTKNAFPGRLYLLLGKVSKEEVVRVLSGYLPYQSKGREDFAEKVSVAISNRFPLE